LSGRSIAEDEGVDEAPQSDILAFLTEIKTNAAAHRIVAVPSMLHRRLRDVVR